MTSASAPLEVEQMGFKQKRNWKGEFSQDHRKTLSGGCEESGAKVRRTESHLGCLQARSQAIPYAVLSGAQMQGLGNRHLTLLQVLPGHPKAWRHICHLLPFHQWPVKVLCGVIHHQGEDPKKLHSHTQVCSLAPTRNSTTPGDTSFPS